MDPMDGTDPIQSSIGSDDKIQHPLDDWIGSDPPKSIRFQPMNTPTP